MRRLMILSAFLTVFLLPISGPAWAVDVDVTSKISAATVYNDRASVTRFAVVKVPAGPHNLVFKGLPVSLFSDSLRVEGMSKANVTFGALSSKYESFEDFVVPREKELNAQLVLLQDQKNVHQAEKKALTIAKTFLENLGKQAALREDENIAEINLNPERWGLIADSLAHKMSDNLRTSLGLDIKIRETQGKIQKVRNELRGLRTGQKQSLSVTIPFDADKEADVTIELSYQISGASWQPLYDARLDVKTTKMELVQYGSVYQRTGEDWEDIDLTLSTAQPSRGTGLPDLYTNWVTIGQNYTARKKDGNFGLMASNMSGHSAMPMAQMEMVAMDMAEEVMAAPMKRVAVQAAQINTEGFVGEYKITGPATVRADGTQAKLLVGAFDVKTALQVQIKPALSNDAYLVVKATLQGDAPILPGQVNLFRDGAYIGQSRVDMLRPNDVEELAFGIDDNVTVKRNMIKDERSESGLITKETMVERHYVTDIQNLHKTPVQIAVLDTVPVSKDERVRVQILKAKTTAGYEGDLKNVKGVTRWIKDMAPNAKAQVNLGWTVSWPKDQSISGL